MNVLLNDFVVNKYLKKKKDHCTYQHPLINSSSLENIVGIQLSYGIWVLSNFFSMIICEFHFAFSIDQGHWYSLQIINSTTGNNKTMLVQLITCQFLGLGNYNLACGFHLAGDWSHQHEFTGDFRLLIVMWCTQILRNR